MAVINNVAYSWSMITLASTALGIDEGSTTLEGYRALNGIRLVKLIQLRTWRQAGFNEGYGLT